MHFFQALRLSALATSAVLACGASLAAFPDRAITIVVPTAPGGANDAMTRVLGQAISVSLKQSVIVENKAGANGSIASEFVARAKPDGYTLMLGYIATHAMNPALQKLRYDPIKDFEPVAMVGSSATLMVANTSVKANNAKELVALMKANPSQFSYASAGTGTGPHFAAEMFKLSTGTNMVHVPYKGSAPAVTDTISGQTQLMFPSLFTASPWVKSGKLKAIGIAGNKRSTTVPDIPTLKEQGIDNVDVSQWYAIFAPAKTPKDIVEQLNKAFNAALADPAVVKKLEDQGAEVDIMTTDQMRTYLAQEQVKWKKVVEAAKLTTD
ncbi:Bug family tripartite tricarboxylate transporter substrate binding protein [Ottowia thiooxydans]|uniref:Tripartite-type tricarboxylate transporter receptor subunit TctC n=1 Tax=Ottowia thiooxydans TaxID=219182 RepID=A0ABV2QDW9_9BURK